MIVLGLDTSTLRAGLALLDDDRVIAAAHHEATGRSNDLLLALDALCRGAGIAPTAIEAVACGAGPGSFTGLRIGLATAKGIAFAAGRPLWLVSSLAALADDVGAAPDTVVVATLDARRNEVYAGCYRAGAPLADERVLAPGALAGWVAELAGAAPVVYAGNARAAYAELLPAGATWAEVEAPSGIAVARLALAGPREDALRAGAPTYIRPSEAEVMYPDGVPGAQRVR